MKKFFASILLAALIFQVSSADWEAPEEDSAPAVRLPVVMYHHIATEPERWGDYVVSVEEFESDLRYFQEQGYTSISVQELCAWYDGKFTMPDKPMMITFDDGYESTAVYAVPLLERYGFQAVVAVIGSVAQM